ncbi:MAG: hypothetical protein WBH03_09260, partial [Cyclobacteriaceae bacterium]
IKMAMVPLRNYVPTEIPGDTTDLVIANGNISNDQAYIYVQGGPNYVLFTDTFNPLLEIEDSESLLKVYPQQSQIINTSAFAAKPTLTKKQASYELDQSVEILSRTISYFKNQGKAVFVICHSYGSEIGLEYLLNKTNHADKVVLMGLNLDMDLRNIEAIKKGKIVVWEDGINPVEQDPFPALLQKTSLKEKFTNMSMLMLNGEKRFTQLLKDTDLSNVIYVYGEKDAAVGRPKQHEIDFLKNKNVELIKLDGGHMSMWSPEFMNELYTKLKE